MDAWLPQYKELKHGTSMIICRNREFDEILEQLSACGKIERISMNKAHEAQKELIDFKNNAGNHKNEICLQKRVRKLFKENYQDKEIISKLRKLVYKQNLKKRNILLWSLIEIKDMVIK